MGAKKTSSTKKQAAASNSSQTKGVTAPAKDKINQPTIPQVAGKATKKKVNKAIIPGGNGVGDAETKSTNAMKSIDDLWKNIGEMLVEEVDESGAESDYVEKPMTVQEAFDSVAKIQKAMKGVPRSDWKRRDVLAYAWSLQEAQRPRFGSDAGEPAQATGEAANARIQAAPLSLSRRLEAPKTKFNGDSGTFRMWKRSILIWMSQYIDNTDTMTKTEDKRLGAALFDSVTGSASEILQTRILPGNETYSEIMSVLCKSYDASRLPEALEAMRKFEQFERADGSSLLTFLNQFENLRSRAEATGGPMGHTVGHVLLTKARLSAPNHTGVMRYINSTPGGLNSNNFPDFDTVVAQLKLMDDGYAATAMQQSNSRRDQKGQGKGKGSSTAMYGSATNDGWDDIGGFWIEQNNNNHAFVTEPTVPKREKKQGKGEKKSKKKDGKEVWKPNKPSKGKGKGGEKKQGKGKGKGKGSGKGGEKLACFEWRDTGSCSWGDQCRFSHDTGKASKPKGQKRKRSADEPIAGIVLKKGPPPGEDSP